ncbi:MAG: hypothetical protein KA099_03740 [Alphaproteobacteria bacterium]|nr:hypothetical protein [Alphaproteobacteria bacterium]MBP7759673.1 hypothetical protein [Alphaproteobacteria bacterium]MBP7763023.1 hypothetical protein [Alphaproteobacteria bacterium]MBP7904418.1 hypothetical protein [Alphaproteobacteria bacterium]
MKKICSRPASSTLLMLFLILLAGCGIKPNHVDPPEGAEESTFPNVYPSPQTDPQPGLEQKDTLTQGK